MLYFSAEAYDPLLSNWEYHNQMGYHAVDFRWLCCKYTVIVSLLEENEMAGSEIGYF